MDTITISMDEYERLMTAQIILNIICSMIESYGYEADQAIADVLGLRPQIVNKEARHG